jgi:hypothetical protein
LGAIGDLIMLSQIHEWDLTVRDELASFLKEFCKALDGATLMTHSSFKTATLTLSDATRLDFFQRGLSTTSIPEPFP